VTTPLWAIAVAYWLHMLATVLWIGGLAVLTLLVLPAAQKTMDNSGYAEFLNELRRRLDAVGWLCMLVLLASGMLQMSVSSQYEGFLSITSIWAGAILIKHLLFFLMIVSSGVVTWGVIPALRRTALLRALGKEAPNMELLQSRSTRLMQLNVVLGLLVLLMTAVARAN
jgi:uncharacterized membrane protein